MGSFKAHLRNSLCTLSVLSVCVRIYRAFSYFLVVPQCSARETNNEKEFSWRLGNFTSPKKKFSDSRCC
jgi:hypothetical protein